GRSECQPPLPPSAPLSPPPPGGGAHQSPHRLRDVSRKRLVVSRRVFVEKANESVRHLFHLSQPRGIRGPHFRHHPFHLLPDEQQLEIVRAIEQLRVEHSRHDERRCHF